MTSEPKVTAGFARNSRSSASDAGDATVVAVTQRAPSPSAKADRRRKWQFVNLTTESSDSRDLSTTNGREFWRSVRRLRPMLTAYGHEGGKMVAHYRAAKASDYEIHAAQFFGRLVAL